MVRNYLITALRTLKRNKGYALINVFGLVIGITFSCMLYVYVSHELSYDEFHVKSDRIFRVLTIDQRDPSNVMTYGVTVPPMGPELVNSFPEVTEMVRLYRFVGQVVFDIDGKNFQERSWFAADENFFDVFDFEFVRGDKASALQEPHGLVMTESMAKKYFSDRDPIGQIIEKTSFGPVKVTGVIRDHSGNSHLKFDLLFSSVRSDDAWRDHLNSWTDFDAYTYVVLRQQGDIYSLRSKLPPLVREKFAKFNGGIDVHLQALEDIYLHSSSIEEGAESVRGELKYIYIFSSMAIFVLLIASINYINLATSKATARSREVGVRKVVGARHGQLMLQFMTESFLLTGSAAVIAIFAMKLAYPFFNQITGKDFGITPDSLGTYILPLAVIAVLIGTLSGGYPALFLARMKPVSSLKARAEGSKSSTLRRVLVIFQFVITIVMIVSTLVISRQLEYIRDKDIGFDKDRLMVIDINDGNVRRDFRSIKNEYLALPGVDQVAVSSRVPGEWKNIAELYAASPSSGPGVPDSVRTYFMGFDEDMLATYKLRLMLGRYFSGSINDSTNILLNESAVRALGLAEPVGTSLTLKRGDRAVHGTVIGVIQDFNFQSLHQKVAPIVIGAWNNPFQSIDYFTLKISGDSPKLVEQITRIHGRFDQRTPIEYHFLNEQLEGFYQTERRAGMLVKMGEMLSVLLACLGLLGLATYNIQRRTKELGIRKALGATAANLFILLSSSFIRQIVIAFLIAAPLGWFLMRQWLSAFEYRVSLGAGIFFLSGFLALLIALATVSYRTIKAAQINPADTLRQE